MDPVTFAYEDLHVRVDRGVLGLFRPNTVETTFRPAGPGASISGVVRDPHAALYGADRSAV